MCEFASFFVHDQAAKLPRTERYLFGDLWSHSKTMELCGQAYGAPDCWREAEWTDSEEHRLSIRSLDASQARELLAVVLADFPTRDALLVFALGHFPPSLKRIDLRSLTTLPAAVTLPPNLEWLNLNSLTTLPATVTLPPSLKTLYLDSLTALPATVTLPPNLKYLNLGGLTDHQGKSQW